MLQTSLLHGGTRSERDSMVIVQDDGTVTPLHVVGENPFAPSSLEPLLGARVRVNGMFRNRTLRVSVDDVIVPDRRSSPTATSAATSATTTTPADTVSSPSAPDEQEKP